MVVTDLWLMVESREKTVRMQEEREEKDSQMEKKWLLVREGNVELEEEK